MRCVLIVSRVPQFSLKVTIVVSRPIDIRRLWTVVTANIMMGGWWRFSCGIITGVRYQRVGRWPSFRGWSHCDCALAIGYSCRSSLVRPDWWNIPPYPFSWGRAGVNFSSFLTIFAENDSAAITKRSPYQNVIRWSSAVLIAEILSQPHRWRALSHFLRPPLGGQKTTNL